MAKKSKVGAYKGRMLGSLGENGKGTKFIVSIKINTKRYSRNIYQYIYLYHKKQLPKYMRHLDGNITNNRIENLEACLKSKANEKRPAKGFYQEYNGFRVVMTWNKHKKTYGNYPTEQIAEEVFNEVKKLRYIDLLNHNQTLIEINKKYSNFKTKNYLPCKGWSLKSGKYQSSIKINNKDKYLGRFDTPEEAHAAYLKAKEEYKNEMAINKNA